jgi:HTH-type transcriptional regulator/antitoxin HigA
MSKVTKEQYEFARARVEELLPLVNGNTPVSDKNMVELSLVSDVVEEYEIAHYPIEKPTIGVLIKNGLEEKGMTQKALASILEVSPSRVNDFIVGRAEPSLRIASQICYILNIPMDVVTDIYTDELKGKQILHDAI